ncbi:MAG: hypothetical protein AB1531_08300, partial [Chloroflexota bacterium]
ITVKNRIISANMTAQEFLAYLDQIPHLLDLARQQDEIFRYRVQDEMRRQHREEGRPFLYSMPMRHLYRCPLCEMETTDIFHELEDPRRESKFRFSEIVLHQAAVHAVPPEADLAAFLEMCLKETR